MGLNDTYPEKREDMYPEAGHDLERVYKERHKSLDVSFHCNVCDEEIDMYVEDNLVISDKYHSCGREKWGVIAEINNDGITVGDFVYMDW